MLGAAKLSRGAIMMNGGFAKAKRKKRIAATARLRTGDTRELLIID